MRICLISVMVAAALLLQPGAAAAKSRPLSQDEVGDLVELYASDGYDRTYLKSVFGDQRVRYVPGLVRKIVIPPDFSANYKRFTAPPAIERARAFSSKWRTALKQASGRTGVDQEVIVAILLVETSLGEQLGGSPVLSVFASMLLENGRYRDEFARRLENNARQDHYLKRLKRKAAWAKEELRALITMHLRRSIDVGGLKGSYAGAFGIAQFLPTSYLKWAHSGTDQRSPDLFYVPHAISSVANFLQMHGWKQDMPDQQQRKVIWNYNRSTTYVDTVLEIARTLQQETRRVKAAQENS